MLDSLLNFRIAVASWSRSSETGRINLHFIHISIRSRNSFRASCLLDNEDTVHTGTTVRFTVVLVSSGGGELHGEGITFLSELFVHGDALLVNSRWDGILIEDDVMGSSLVVGPVINKEMGETEWSVSEQTTLEIVLTTLNSIRTT